MFGGYSGGYGTSHAMFGLDWTVLLLIGGFVLTMLVSAQMKNTTAKYSKIQSRSGLTGAQAALQILHAAGITDVAVRSIPGQLTDHYDPRNKTVNLSETSYQRASLTAVGVAAHECGHAIQDNTGYVPLKLRSAIVPAANLGSTLSWPIFLVGLFSGLSFLTTIGIILFTAAVIFQLVTLPVELNASSRALKMLENTHIMQEDELSGSRKVLRAAAMTYVAALASSILQLLRLIILAGGRNRD